MDPSSSLLLAFSAEQIYTQKQSAKIGTPRVVKEVLHGIEILSKFTVV